MMFALFVECRIMPVQIELQSKHCRVPQFVEYGSLVENIHPSLQVTHT